MAVSAQVQGPRWKGKVDPPPNSLQARAGTYGGSREDGILRAARAMVGWPAQGVGWRPAAVRQVRRISKQRLGREGVGSLSVRQFQQRRRDLGAGDVSSLGEPLARTCAGAAVAVSCARLVMSGAQERPAPMCVLLGRSSVNYPQRNSSR